MKKFIVFIILFAPCFAFAQRSLKDVNRGTFPVARQGVAVQEAEENKRPANTMDASGQYIGPTLVPVVIDGVIVYVPKDKALVITSSTQTVTEEPAPPTPYKGISIKNRPYRDTANPKIRNWPRVFLGVDKAEDFLSGRGIIVAIFDSGVNPHEQFSNNNVDVLDVTDSGNANDDYGHGTAVAGIIGGSGIGESGFASVAPGVRIKAYKIADKNGLTNNVLIASAVENVLQYNAAHPNDKISLINISYGLEEDDEYLKNALKKAYDGGITIVASAGNSGGNFIAYPAAYDFVISVAGVNHRGKFVQTSSRGKGVDFVAPGAGIFAPDNLQDYGWVRGTSFATAYITGVAALVSEAYQNKYGSKPSPAQVYSILVKISSPLPDIEKAEQGNGSPDASKILSLI